MTDKLRDEAREIRDIYRAPNGDEFHCASYGGYIEYQLPNCYEWSCYEAIPWYQLKSTIEGWYKVWSDK